MGSLCRGQALRGLLVGHDVECCVGYSSDQYLVNNEFKWLHFSTINITTMAIPVSLEGEGKDSVTRSVK